MKFGATRYGPFAPSTSQFGKYDVFTRIGVPILSTLNDTVLVPSTMSLTLAFGTACSLVGAPVVMRCHSFGPSLASSTFHCEGSRYQASAMSCQARPPLDTSVTTAGSAVI